MTNRYPGITDEHAAAIVAREPFEGGQVRGYLAPDGAYIVGSPAAVNDDDEPRDLLAIYPDDSVEALRFTANAEPILRILADARAEAVARAAGVTPPTTWQHSRKGPITGHLVGHDGTWARIRLAGDQRLRMFSRDDNGARDDEEIVTVRASFLSPEPTPAEVIS
ncbi:hypothetical protein SEA_KOZIE_67 [Microbacterium phage Kozie]|uniref:Uncharacterized protein n=1 Tax=Microbacterium phage Kozie TaxID=2885981 RepID=A0AAE9C2U7_9CAUD|nr:hypothetical protein QC998_gp67 [Microbacterium phage Kozie]UDL16263.1 hypothetical protein SEA_KOZIE_67 [Microbacterium phage Kozie]